MQMELTKRKEELAIFIKDNLPTFYELVEKARQDKGSQGILLHQDAFCADYEEDEYVLLGMAIKYAGMFGVGVRIHGLNRDTLYDITKHKS